MSIREGGIYLFYWGTEAVAAQMNTDLQSQLNSRNISHKQSGDHTETKGTRFEGSISLTLLFDDDSLLDPIDLWDAHKAKTEEDVKISTEETGDFEFTGTGRIDNWQGGFPDQENIEVSVEVTLTGDYDFSEITA